MDYQTSLKFKMTWDLSDQAKAVVVLHCLCTAEGM